MPLRLFLRGLFIATALPLGCTGDAFGCLEQEQCGDGGQCEDNGYCSFPDAECASGRRFADNATDGVANVCVPVATATGTVGDGTSSSASTSTTSTDPAFTSSTSFGSSDTGALSTAETESSGYFGTFGSGGFETGSTTFDATTSAGDTSSGTTGRPVDCIEDNANDCSDCFACTDDAECENLAAECDAIAGCGEVGACLSACETDGLCFEDCCEGRPPAAIEAALALSACHQDHCASVFCPEFANAECNGT